MRKKYTFFAATAVSLFIILATTSALTTLGTIAEPHPPHLTAGNLLTGHAHQIYLSNETWQHFPGRLLPLSRFVDYRAVGIMSAIFVAILWIGPRLAMDVDHPAIAIACLLGAAVPYGIGLAALARNTELEAVGPWMSTMLLGILYGGLACALISGRQLFRPRTPKDATRFESTTIQLAKS